MRWEVVHSDCIDAMKAMPEASVDAVVTDPPYELGFMSKDWDKRGIAFDPATWREVLRVLKPGGHLLAFGGTRTYHRMACAIEDAGFEIRDSIHWVYGSGFPKSLNLGDGRGTALKPAHEPIVLARKPLGSTVAECVQGRRTGAINVDACRVGVDSPTQWIEVAPGVLRNSKCSFFPSPCQGHDDAGRSQSGATVHADRNTRGRDGEASADRRYGDVGGTNFAATPGPRGGDVRGRWPSNLLLSHADGCVRVGRKTIEGITGGVVNRGSASNEMNTIYGGGMGGAGHPTFADVDGREEVDDWRCADGCPVAEMDRQSGVLTTGTYDIKAHHAAMGYHGANGSERHVDGDSGGASRFFPCFAPDPLDDVAPFFYAAKASRAEREDGCEALPARTAEHAVDRDPDSAGAHNPRAGAGRGAGATRYRCSACGKGLSGGGDDHGETSACEATEDGQHVKVEGAKGKAIRNVHPTVKPIALMRWLVRLVTPLPDGLVLDPFAGSGSTGVAAVLERLNFIGIEREAEYVAIACARIAHAVEVKHGDLGIEVKRDDGTVERVVAKQAELF